MRRNLTLWVIAFVITLASAVYQRMTGPTYPVRGRIYLGGSEYALRLTRTHEGSTNQPVRLTIPDPAVTGDVVWRRFPTNDEVAHIPLRRHGDVLEAELPNQPPAGKLEYQVHLVRGPERVAFPAQAAVTRFKGPVSAGVLIPHVFAMFLGMLFSTRAGLEALLRGPRQRWLTWVTVTLLVAGGLVLGPMMQKAAFDAYWTGAPFGYDLTDNKTLIAIVAWMFAAWRVATRRSAAWSVGIAAVVTLVIFMIPHSVWGSELKWE